MSDQPKSEKFETWAIVEVMGHSRFAGWVTEQSFGGASFVRVDVPEVPPLDGPDLPSWKRHGGRPAFTKLLGAASIFAITPCTEGVARAAATQFLSPPLSQFDFPQRPRLEAADEPPEQEDEEDEYDFA